MTHNSIQQNGGLDHIARDDDEENDEDVVDNRYSPVYENNNNDDDFNNDDKDDDAAADNSHCIDNDDDDEGDDDENGDVVPDADAEGSGIPIDKGRAWFVMLSCFLMHILVVGGGKAFGVFFQEFQDRFQVDAKELGVVNGMALMLMLGLGIFVNLLAVRFSARRVVTAGSVLASAGFIMTAFIPSFEWLYVTYGLITGLGFGLSFSPTIVMMGQCFKKYRSIAFGFALSGSGVGSFVFPNLVRLLINAYNLQGCLLIIGAVMLNVAICGFLLPARNGKPKRRKQPISVENTETNSKENISLFSRNPNCGANLKRGDKSDVCSRTEKDSKGCARRNNGEKKEGQEEGKVEEQFVLQSSELNRLLNGKENKILGDVSISISDVEEIKVEEIDTPLEIKKEIKLPNYDRKIFQTNKTTFEEISLRNGHNGIRTNAQNVLDRPQYDDVIYLHTTDKTLSKSAHHLPYTHDAHQVKGKESHLPINHKNKHAKLSISTSHLPDILKQRTFLAVQNYVNPKMSKQGHYSSFAYASNCDLAMVSQGGLDRISIFTSRSREHISTTRNGIERDKKKPPLFELSLLRHPPFIMHLLSAYLGYTCYINNLFMLADYATSCGLSRDTAALTLSVIGVLEIFGRLTFPLITDVVCCKRRRSWACVLTVMGLLNLLMPQMTSLTSLMVYAVIFGYACGCFGSLVPVLCAETNGPEKMGSSFGFTTIAMGLAVMTGPPLCGTIKDKTGHWDYGFVTVGVFALISALLSFLEPCVQKRINRNNPQTTDHKP